MQLQKLSGAVAPLDPELEKLKQDIRQAEREAANLQGSFVVLKQVHVKTEQELAAAHRRIEELQRELAAARGDGLKVTTATQCPECGRLTQRLKLVESEVERERQLRVLSQKAAAALVRDVEALKEELQRAKDAAASEGDVSALRETEAALRKELLDLKTEFEEARQRHDQSLKSLQSEVEHEHKHRKAAKKTAARVQHELEALQIELRQTRDSAGGDQASLRQELQDVQTQYEEERTRYAQSVESMTEQIGLHHQRIEAERQRATALQEQVDVLHAKAKAQSEGTSEDVLLLRQSEVDTRKELQALKAEYEAARKDRLELQSRLQEQEDKYQQLQAATQQKEGKDSSNADELRRLRAEIAEFQRTGVLTKGQLLQQENDTNLLREQLDKARASDANSTKTLDEARKRMQAELSAKDQELQALATEKQAMEKDKCRLEKELEELQQRMQTEEPPKVQELMVLKTAKLAAEKEKQRLANELEKLRQRTQTEATANSQRVEALEAEKLEIEKQRHLLEAELHQLRDRAQRAEDDQLRALAMEKQEAEREKRRLEIENERLESERRHLKSEIALLQDERLVEAVDTPDPQVVAKQKREIEQLQESVGALTRENAKLNTRIEQLMDELCRDTTRGTKIEGDKDSGGAELLRFNPRDLERGASPSDAGGTDWKNQLSKPKASEATAAEKAYAMRYGGRNILARGGDTITYLSK